MTARAGSWRAWCLCGAGLIVGCAHATDEVVEDEPAVHSKSGSKSSGGSAGAAGASKGGSSAAAGNGGSAAGSKTSGGAGRGGSPTSDGGADAAGGAPNPDPEPEPMGGAGPGVTGDLQVQYKTGNGNASDNQIRMGLRIVSGAAAAAALSSLELRYYFTSEVALPLQVEIYDAAVNGAAGYRTVTKDAVKAEVTSSDGYLDITFTDAAGALQSGESLTLDVVVHGPNWTGNFSEADDYSFAADHTDFVAWNHVTLFSGKTLIWGIEPP